MAAQSRHQLQTVYERGQATLCGVRVAPHHARLLFAELSIAESCQCRVDDPRIKFPTNSGFVPRILELSDPERLEDIGFPERQISGPECWHLPFLSPLMCGYVSQTAIDPNPEGLGALALPIRGYWFGKKRSGGPRSLRLQSTGDVSGPGNPEEKIYPHKNILLDVKYVQISGATLASL